MSYDKYPETRIAGHEGEAWEGAEAVVAKLGELAHTKDHVLVVECYPGVDREVLELVCEAFKPDTVINSDDIFYDGDELTARMQPHLTDDRVRGVMYYGRLEDFVDPEAHARAKAAVPTHGRTLVYVVGAGLVFPAERYVNRFPAKKHDHFLIPAGTIHCSAANAMVLEISATPYNFTFKLWDWDCLGLDGLPRPIHIDDGLANIQLDRTIGWVCENLVNATEVIHNGEDYLEEHTSLRLLGATV